MTTQLHTFLRRTRVAVDGAVTLRAAHDGDLAAELAPERDPADAVLVDLGAGAGDPSVAADAERLRAMAAAWLRRIAARADARRAPDAPVAIRYVGRGRRLASGGVEVYDDDDDDAARTTHDAATPELRAINPTTRNEFVLSVPPALLGRARGPVRPRAGGFTLAAG